MRPTGRATRAGRGPRARNAAPGAPSTARWSIVRLRVITSRRTGRSPSHATPSWTRPTPRMATLGGLITGVKKSMPLAPEGGDRERRAVELVDADRAVAARRGRGGPPRPTGPASERRSASAIDGHEQPVGHGDRDAEVDVGVQRDGVAVDAGVEPGVVGERLHRGAADEIGERDADAVGLPRRRRARVRSSAASVMSTSMPSVSCAISWRLACMRSAMTLRMPRSGTTSLATGPATAGRLGGGRHAVGGRLDVLLGDPPARTGARDQREVDAALLGQPAGDRRRRDRSDGVGGGVRPAPPRRRRRRSARPARCRAGRRGRARARGRGGGRTATPRSARPDGRRDRRGPLVARDWVGSGE